MNSYYLEAIFIFLIGYFCGCFQTSYFISRKFRNKDIRTLGTGNAGASNVTAEMGWKYGTITGVSDVLKAFIPVQLVLFIVPKLELTQQHDLMVIAGTGAILGHIYPFFMGFRGGKGIACYLGMLLAIDWKIGLISLAFLILLTIITDYISVGSILLYISIPLLIYLTGNYYSNIVIGCTSLLMIVGLVKHWINVQRIMSGTEKGLRSVIFKNK